MEAPNVSTSSEDDRERPVRLVMIPEYIPREDHLEQALRNVLIQDPGTVRMQIEVVDDYSNDVAVLAKGITGERLE
jgi:hypothetical protein